MLETLQDTGREDPLHQQRKYKINNMYACLLSYQGSTHRSLRPINPYNFWQLSPSPLPTQIGGGSLSVDCRFGQKSFVDCTLFLAKICRLDFFI